MTPLDSSATTTTGAIHDPWAAAPAQAIQDPWAPQPVATTPGLHPALMDRPPPAPPVVEPQREGGGVLDMLTEVPLGLVAGSTRVSGHLVKGLGGLTSWAGGLFDRDDDPRTLNTIQRSGRKLQRFGEQMADNADILEFDTTTGKVAKFAGEVGTDLLATMATAGRLPGAPTSVLGRSLQLAIGSAPVTAAHSFAGESLVGAGAALLGEEELAKTFEGNAALRIAADLGLNTTLGLATDLGLAKIVQVRQALRKGADKAATATAQAPTPITDEARLLANPDPRPVPTPGEVPLGPAIPTRPPTRLLPPGTPDPLQGPAILMGGPLTPEEVTERLGRAAAQVPESPLIEIPDVGRSRSARTQAQMQAEIAAGAGNAEQQAARQRVWEEVSDEATRVLEAAREAGRRIRAAEGGGIILNAGVIPPMEAFKTELGKRALRSGSLVGIGTAMQGAEDERLQATGKELVAWGIMAALYPNLKAAGIRGGTAVRDALMQSPTGQKVVRALSYDYATDPVVRELVKEYEQAVAKGQARAQELASGAARLGPQADRRISDLIEREAFEPVMGADTPEVLALAQRIADEFTQIGRSKVRLGLMSPETLAAREGMYLPRIYGVHLGEEAVTEVPIAGGRKVRIKGDARRLDLPDDIRNALGEVREASFRTRQGVERGYRDIAAATLFTRLKHIPGAVLPESVVVRDAANAARRALADASAAGASREELNLLRLQLRNAEHREMGLAKDFAKPKAGYVRMPDTEAMGPLRNMVVRQDVGDYLDQLPDNQTAGKLLRGLAAWKKAHTVWNPGTHVGNMFSNVAMAHMGGLPYHRLPKALARATKSWGAYDDDVRFLAEHGVLSRGLPTYGDPSVLAGPEDKLRALIETTRPETKAALASQGITPKSTLRKAGEKLDHAAQAAYAKEDGVFRVALFQELVHNKGMAREAAADFVHRQFVDYGTRSPILRTISRTLSPFIMFPAKAIPHISDQVMQYPERWLALMALWGGMDQFSRRQVGPMDFTDLPENERYKGYFLPGRVQLPFTDRETGNQYTIDAARWTPFSAISGSPAPGTAARQLSPDIPQILAPTGPLIDIGSVASGRDPYTGDELYKEWMSPVEKAKVLAQQLWRFVAPTAASIHVPRVMEDLANLDQKAAIVDALGTLGLRPQVVRLGSELDRAAWAKARALGEVRSDYNRSLRKAENNPAKQDELTALYEQRLLRIEAQYLRRINEYEAAKQVMEGLNQAQPGVQFTPR